MALLFRGQSGQRIKLRAEGVKAIVIPAAPFDVQVASAHDLEQERCHIANAVHHIQRSIELLGERRQALITAAVTGQLDVTTARGVGLP